MCNCYIYIYSIWYFQEYRVNLPFFTPNIQARLLSTRLQRELQVQLASYELGGTGWQFSSWWREGNDFFPELSSQRFHGTSTYVIFVGPKGCFGEMTEVGTSRDPSAGWGDVAGWDGAGRRAFWGISWKHVESEYIFLSGPCFEDFR